MKVTRELVLFVVVGISATATHYYGAILGIESLKLDAYTANFLGYISALGVSYYGQAKLTFKARIDRSTFIRFLALSFGNFALSQLGVYVLSSVLEINHYIVFAIIVLSIPAISYVGCKFWVYR